MRGAASCAMRPPARERSARAPGPQSTARAGRGRAPVGAVGHVGGALHAGDRHQVRGDDRPRHGNGARARIEGAGGQRRPENLPGQFAPGIDDVRAACAGGPRLVAHLLEIHSLAQIERERGHLGVEPVRPAPTMAAAPSRLPPYATTRRFVIDRISPFNRTSRSRAPVPSRAMTRIVSSPAIVPTTSPNCARSIAIAAACACPGPVRSTIRFCTRSTPRHKLGHRPAQTRSRPSRPAGPAPSAADTRRRRRASSGPVP